MRIRIFIVFICWLSVLQANAQTGDGFIKTPDSLRNWYADALVYPSAIKPMAFVAPAAFIAYGMVALHNNRALKKLDFNTRAAILQKQPPFSTRIDDYLQFGPAAAVYALNLSGLKGKHNLFDVTMLMASTTLLTTAATHLVKNSAGKLRPDGSAYNSFPSGHTSTAFSYAELLYQEYKDTHPWIGYAGYAVAAATASLRVYNNRHWVSDVVAGAGFGMASTKMVYLIYPPIKRLFTGHKPHNFSVMPYYGQAVKGFILMANF